MAGELTEADKVERANELRAQRASVRQQATQIAAEQAKKAAVQYASRAAVGTAVGYCCSWPAFFGCVIILIGGFVVWLVTNHTGAAVGGFFKKILGQ